MCWKNPRVNTIWAYTHCKIWWIKHYWMMNRIKYYHKCSSKLSNSTQQGKVKHILKRTGFFLNIDKYCFGSFWIDLQIQCYVPNYHTIVSNTPFTEVIFHTRHMIITILSSVMLIIINVKYKNVLKYVWHIIVIIAKHEFTCQVNTDARKF